MERLIVFALILLLPTQLAYHFWPQFSYIQGLRVDYLAPAIYLTDVFIVLLLPYIKKRLYLLFPVLLFAFVNTLFAQIPAVAFFKWLTVLKLAVLGIYFYSCDLGKLKKSIINDFTLSIIAIFLIGLLQFIFQKTLGGPLYYLGERSFTSLTPGISLMNLFGRSMMKAYSIFSHPNSFAAFTVVSFLILLSFKEQFYLSFFVVLTLLLTFSLNAILGVILILCLFFVLKYLPKTIEKTKRYIPITLIGTSFIFGTVSLLIPSGRVLRESYRDRVILAGSAIQTFSARPILGVGLNNFFSLTNNVQPPHNIYLIVLSEVGILGVLVVFVLLTKLIIRKQNKYLFLALVFILFTGLFDHYSFSLQQNQIIFAILLGLSARKVYH